MATWIWDPKKAASNLKKHQVSFTLAERALDDPLALTDLDPQEEEERFRTLGQPSHASSLVLFVVHTYDEASDSGRIISARKATANERNDYEGR